MLTADGARLLIVGRCRRRPDAWQRACECRIPDHKRAVVLEGVKVWPGKAGLCRKVGATANLDSSCARRRERSAGRDERATLRRTPQAAMRRGGQLTHAPATEPGAGCRAYSAGAAPGAGNERDQAVRGSLARSLVPVTARGRAGSCSTVARCPGSSRVTNTIWPLAPGFTPRDCGSWFRSGHGRSPYHC